MAEPTKCVVCMFVADSVEDKLKHEYREHWSKPTPQPEPPHQHQHTIPVAWIHGYSHNDKVTPAELAQAKIPYNISRATALACPCGDIKQLEWK